MLVLASEIYVYFTFTFLLSCTFQLVYCCTALWCEYGTVYCGVSTVQCTVVWVRVCTVVWVRYSTVVWVRYSTVVWVWYSTVVWVRYTVLWCEYGTVYCGVSTVHCTVVWVHFLILFCCSASCPVKMFNLQYRYCAPLVVLGPKFFLGSLCFYHCVVRPLSPTVLLGPYPPLFY